MHEPEAWREIKRDEGSKAGCRGTGGSAGEGRHLGPVPLTATLRTLHIEGAKGGQVRMAMG